MSYTVLTITDHDCSKAAIFVPCNETIAQQDGKLYATYVFPHYLPSEESHFDKGRPALPQLLARELRSARNQADLLSAYHPQTIAKARDHQSRHSTYACTVSTIRRTGAAWLTLSQ